MSDARFCYVVLCHTDPAGVLRLVRRIRQLSPAAGVIVRHDVRDLFGPGEVEAAGGVPHRSGIAVRWGDWSQVAMQLEVLEVAPRLVPADRYVVISGQDYPVRDLQAWEAEVTAGGADACLEPMTPQPRDHERSWRVRREPEVGPLLARRAVRAAARRAAPVLRPVADAYPVTRGDSTRWWVGTPRRAESPVPVLKASEWSVYSARACEAVLAMDRDRPDVREFFRTVRTPDEHYVPSLLAAAGVQWEPRTVTVKRFPPGASSPDWLDADTLATVVDGRAPFARKFPPGADDRLVAEADRLAAADRAPA